jgi:hypothetical protein
MLQTSLIREMEWIPTLRPEKPNEVSGEERNCIDARRSTVATPPILQNDEG